MYSIAIYYKSSKLFVLFMLIILVVVKNINHRAQNLMQN